MTSPFDPVQGHDVVTCFSPAGSRRGDRKRVGVREEVRRYTHTEIDVENRFVNIVYKPRCESGRYKRDRAGEVSSLDDENLL